MQQVMFCLALLDIGLLEQPVVSDTPHLDLGVHQYH